MTCFSNNAYKFDPSGNICLSEARDIFYEANLQIFPNPIHDSFILSVNENIATALKDIGIYNVVGERMRSIDPNLQNRYEIDVSGLAGGIYFIKCVFSDGQGVKKIVVNR